MFQYLENRVQYPALTMDRSLDAQQRYKVVEKEHEKKKTTRNTFSKPGKSGT